MTSYLSNRDICHVLLSLYKVVAQMGPLDSEIASPPQINSYETSNSKQVAFEVWIHRWPMKKKIGPGALSKMIEDCGPMCIKLMCHQIKKIFFLKKRHGI